MIWLYRTPPHALVPDAITATEPVEWTWDYLATYLPDPRQPAYPQRCKALARTAGEGEPPSLRRNTVHPAPRQHLFFPRKWYKTPIGCECKNTIVNTNQYNKHT
ncbi:hypothetical protein AVEN_182214-1 [Araneus ventricosus]|uniref:Uncharacterized protein n=1 Tax=Araneus ventricosus TaxID=182803 RepID=A0A4Y2WSU6_ARAVE|nr:hypothetical protein AVEN_182214-1 [Araneus ventricosus]